MKKLLLLSIAILLPSITSAGQITVPSPSSYGQVLRGNSNGTYSAVATSSLGLSPSLTGTGIVTNISTTQSTLSTSSLPVNVKDYGAIGNGTIDDTAAIIQAMNVATTTYRSVFFPAGNYRISSTIFASTSANVYCCHTKTSSFQIYGEGEDVTTITQVTSGQGGFKFYSNAGWDGVYMHDMNITTTNAGTGIGIEFDGPSTAEGTGYDQWNLARLKLSLWATGIHITSTTAFNHAFMEGLYLTYSTLGFWCESTVCESNTFHTLNSGAMRFKGGKHWVIDGFNGGSMNNADGLYGAALWFENTDYASVSNGYLVNSGNNGTSTAAIRVDAGRLTVTNMRLDNRVSTTSATYAIANAAGTKVVATNNDYLTWTNRALTPSAVTSIESTAIGIGTSTPMSPLSVVGNTTFIGNIDLTNKTTDSAPYYIDAGRHFGGPAFKLYSRTDLANKEAGWGQTSDGGMAFYDIGASGDYYGWFSGGAFPSSKATAKMLFDVFNTRLGIGTTSPWRTLSVNGSSDLGTNALAGYFTATTSTASELPYASTTALTATTLYTTDINASQSLRAKGANAGFVVGRRDTLADAWQFYSAAGNLQLYNYSSSADGLTFTSGGNMLFPQTLGANSKYLDWDQSYQGVKLWYYHNTGTGNGNGIGLNGGEIQNFSIGAAGDHWSWNRGTGGLQTTGTNELMRLNADNGRLGIGTTSPYTLLSVAGEVVGQNFTATSTTATSTFSGGFIHTKSYTPASASATCTTGEQTWDATYFYICVGTNAWERVLHDTW